VVGGLGLVVTWLFERRFAQSHGGRPEPGFWWGLAASIMVVAAGALGYVVNIDWFIDTAHYIASAGLLLSIIVVAVDNGLRHDPAESAPGRVLIRDPRRFDRYAWLAWAMIVAAVVGAVLVLNHAIDLFWLEIVVALLFAIFWTVQTFERLPRVDPGTPGGGEDQDGSASRLDAVETEPTL